MVARIDEGTCATDVSAAACSKEQLFPSLRCSVQGQSDDDVLNLATMPRNFRKFDTEDKVSMTLGEFFKSQPPSFWEDEIGKLPERCRRAVHSDAAYLS
ncbi:unnamed protein product [Haemonchus placei]|uniref:INCENP_ARK-bind domain-containing protein n=1 Tax=Haemonchus placei TaxID=6290 RepID=A0A0N4WRY1_HAEPC|nr:unnamed protein product [Haemonchus placei]